LSLVFFLFLCVSASFGDSHRKNVFAKTLFNSWKLKYNKSYPSDEENQIRFNNFKQSLLRVQKRQQYMKSDGAKFGLTKFADLSVQEFKSTILMKKEIRPTPHGGPRHLVKTAPPNVFDWRNSGMVTPVKDQGQCGSCWAFSATETIESAWMLKHKLTNVSMKPLAPQQIVDCDSSDDGCGGGDPPTAYQYVMSAGGQETNSDYPYTGQDGNCAFKSTKVYARVANWAYACQNDDESQLLQSAFTYGPTSICVDANSWQDYDSGILTAWECAWIDMLDHCVQVVGWNLNAQTPYWSVRNSWSTDWGENGYIRLAYGQNTCGMAEEATYVLSA